MPEEIVIRYLIIVGVILLILWIRNAGAARQRREQARRARASIERRQAAPPHTPARPWQAPASWSQPLPTPAVASTSPPPPPPSPPSPRDAVAPPALDLATFAPMSDEQVKAAAGGADLLANRFTFGIRSVIPPVSDPRTLLIDKALVAHGLLTPEELLHIHKVGEAMEEAKPNLAMVAQKAQQAVARTLEEKARLKERKKAEAAERRRVHDAAVAHRKATDIIFLGRGVSKGLADRQSDPAKLDAFDLPILATPGDIANALNLTIPRLRWLAFHSEATTRSHYVRFTIPKRSGGTRNLFAPHAELAAAQAWILANVLEKTPVHAAAHGFVKGRSTLSNAAPHVGQAVVVNADLCDFFPTITFPRVMGIFKRLGYSPAAATIFALICTESPRRPVVYAGKTFHVATGPRALPQGACTSPALSNLAARRLDSRLAGIANKLNYRYTRYADDLTFSTPGPLPVANIGYLLARVHHIAADEGFAVNEKKTRVLKRAARQEVTGVVVNERPGVPRDLYKRLRAILHRAKSEGLAAQNRQAHPHFEAWVGGMVAYVKMINPRQGEALARSLAELG